MNSIMFAHTGSGLLTESNVLTACTITHHCMTLTRTCCACLMRKTKDATGHPSAAVGYPPTVACSPSAVVVFALQPPGSVLRMPMFVCFLPFNTPLACLRTCLTPGLPPQKWHSVPTHRPFDMPMPSCPTPRQVVPHGTAVVTTAVCLAFACAVWHTVAPTTGPSVSLVTARPEATASHSRLPYGTWAGLATQFLGEPAQRNAMVYPSADTRAVDDGALHRTRPLVPSPQSSLFHLARFLTWAAGVALSAAAAHAALRQVAEVHVRDSLADTTLCPFARPSTRP